MGQSKIEAKLFGIEFLHIILNIQVMLQLGMDTEGTELRAKMQSTSLLSDMESFKAANPGSTLSDFVRWHSPRDWEEDSSGKVCYIY